MSKRVEIKVNGRYDEERQRAYMWTSVLAWILIGLFLVLRDPIWRVLYEGNLVSPIRQSSKTWTELDKDLIKKLSSTDTRTTAGNTGLEDSLVAKLDRRRADQTAEGETPPNKIDAPESLRAVARARAETRLKLDPNAEISAPELLLPETYFALNSPDRLIHTVEIQQELPASAPLGDPGFHEELVGGWLNRTRFRTATMQGRDVRVGIGAVSGPSGETMLEVVLDETFAILDSPLAPIVDENTPILLSGERLDDDEVVFYFKGPADPGFYPVDASWTENKFTLQLEWEDGPGIYALRAGRNDRLSDPRPILVD